VLVVVVAVISLLAGIAVTGLPKSVPDDVVSSEISVTTPRPTTTTTAVRATTTTIKAGSTPPNPSVTAATTLAPITSLRVVVANAGSATGAAGRAASELLALGYTNVSAANARTPRADTVVVFAPGFDDEAARLAAQLGLSTQQVAPRTAAPLTGNDAPADLWVLLGRDRA
jgi:hypothetical protein